MRNLHGGSDLSGDGHDEHRGDPERRRREVSECEKGRGGSDARVGDKSSNHEHHDREDGEDGPDVEAEH